MKIEVIFVRHGVSCANEIQNKGRTRNKIFHILYSDPELTRIGKQRSIQLGPILAQKIKDRWGQNPWTIGSSAMIRAQQTAYYMLAKDRNQTIFIMPHICEKGRGQDNTPMPVRDLYKVEHIIQPMSTLLHKPSNFETIQTTSNKSDFRKFQEWVKTEGFRYFEKGPDDVYRSVIFTHSHFLKNIFPDIPNYKDLIANNEAIFYRWDTDNSKSQTVRSRESDIEYIEYGETGQAKKNSLYTCPDECRKWTPCSRKTNSKSRTRKNK